MCAHEVLNYRSIFVLNHVSSAAPAVCSVSTPTFSLTELFKLSSLPALAPKHDHFTQFWPIRWSGKTLRKIFLPEL